MMERTSVVSRNTKETEIQISLNLDGSGKADIQTGIGFFDHMLNSFARHGFFDLTVKVKGDLEVDTHHTIEDTGIVLGQAIKQAVGDKKGIVRYGSQGPGQRGCGRAETYRRAFHQREPLGRRPEGDTGRSRTPQFPLIPVDRGDTAMSGCNI